MKGPLCFILRPCRKISDTFGIWINQSDSTARNSIAHIPSFPTHDDDAVSHIFPPAWEKPCWGGRTNHFSGMLSKTRGYFSRKIYKSLTNCWRLRFSHFLVIFFCIFCPPFRTLWRDKTVDLDTLSSPTLLSFFLPSFLLFALKGESISHASFSSLPSLPREEAKSEQRKERRGECSHIPQGGAINIILSSHSYANLFYPKMQHLPLMKQCTHVEDYVSSSSW